VPVVVGAPLHETEGRHWQRLAGASTSGLREEGTRWPLSARTPVDRPTEPCGLERGAGWKSLHLSHFAPLLYSGRQRPKRTRSSRFKSGHFDEKPRKRGLVDSGGDLCNALAETRHPRAARAASSELLDRLDDGLAPETRKAPKGLSCVQPPGGEEATLHRPGAASVGLRRRYGLTSMGHPTGSTVDHSQGPPSPTRSPR